ncbi:nucleotidyltransferase family protein [Aurantibacter crassamenti]|uniref:nucleotidyltransferase family protein n=1 Tax=Aurantibacter crassamenti TaxID=1837375 RepID=UPI00193ADDF3|nr:nucleotidyltransferase family protein [Aurantibacter crassamenti]MBM1107110.1 nucleotidyltransferase family protein [Aurantibacter crassamenti]
MTNNKEIAILILAAGESIRMGEPKQLLPWKETTLLGNIINEAKLVLPLNINVVLGGNFDAIKNINELKEVNVIYNPNFQQGQGTSISIGINEILKINNSIKAVLILLCDQPLITSQYLKELIVAFTTNTKGIAATKYDNTPGVPAIFHKKYFQELTNLKKDKGAKHTIINNSSDIILVNSNGKEVDIDTKEDYRKLI